MHPTLNRNLFLVKEHVGLFKAANNFDIYDPQTQEQVLQCREDRLGFFTRLLRYTDYKRFTPFDIEVRTPSGQPVVHVRRGISIFLSTVDVHDGDEHGTILGRFKQKFFSIGGAFTVLEQDYATALTSTFVGAPAGGGARAGAIGIPSGTYECDAHHSLDTTSPTKLGEFVALWEAT